MPELPEVDAIAGVTREALGKRLAAALIVRGNGKYLEIPKGKSTTIRFLEDRPIITAVGRIGKMVAIVFHDRIWVVHNAMTGYFDWEHRPWTFDYVEGKRAADDGDVRVKIFFEDGTVLRFHDTRLFGSIIETKELPRTPIELIETPNMLYPHRPLMTLEHFYAGLQETNAPIKVRLMDQSFIGGIGNIYSVEALHVAGILPDRMSHWISPDEASVLHASLVWSVDHCFPQVRYDWLNVYRRTSCGTCGKLVTRAKLGGRSTFFCERCQL